MINYREHITRIIGLLLLQLLIVKEVTFGNMTYYITPFIYGLALVNLPIGMNKYTQLIVAFLLGLTMDMFMNSQGIHASACTFMIFMKPYFIQNKEDLEPNNSINIKVLGFSRFLYLVVVLVTLQHLTVFTLETFGFSYFFEIILRTVLSTTLSILLIYVGIVLFRKNKK